MSKNGTILLADARHVKGHDALILKTCRLRDNPPERHHARAAYSGENHIIGSFRRMRWFRFGQHAADLVHHRLISCTPSLCAAFHGDKGRAETLLAGKILIAAFLVDEPLDTEFRVDRQD